MIDGKKVRGTQDIALPLEFNVDTVYVRSNIVPVDTEEFKGWQYDEIQYDKDEYLQIISEQSKLTNEQLASTQSQLEQSQVAMAELFETLASLQSPTNV